MDPNVPENTVATPAEPVAPAAPVAAPVAAPAAVAPARAAAPVAAAPVAAAPVYGAPVVNPMGYRLIQLVWLAVGVVDVILALDFIFWVTKANNTGFAHYIYRIGGKLSAPFDGIFNTTATHTGSVLRWSDILAIVVYTVAAWIVAKLVRIMSTQRPGVPTAV